MMTMEQVNDLINASREMEEGPTQFVRRIEAAVREQCAAAVASELLEDEPQTEGDLGYYQAVFDCMAAIRKA
jgi:hypothetical protein